MKASIPTLAEISVAAPVAQMSFLDRSFTNVFDISNHPRLKVFSKRGRRVKGCWWRITEPRGVLDHRSTEGSVPAAARHRHRVEHVIHRSRDRDLAGWHSWVSRIAAVSRLARDCPLADRALDG
jgi:hypothetical protein